MISQKNIYLLLGKEDYLKRDFEKRLKYKIFGSNKTDFNVDIYASGNLNAKDIVSSANTLPFISKNRLIIVRDTEKFSLEDKELITRYVKNPSNNTFVVFETSSGNKDSFIDFLNEFAEVFTFERLSKNELSNWIVKKISSFGKKVSPDATKLLLDVLSNDLELISNELEKLVNFAGGKTLITKNDVETIVFKSIEETAFSFADLIGRKQFGEALKLGLEIYDDRKRLPELVGLIGWHFKRLRKIKGLLTKGYSSSSISKNIHIPEFVAKKLIDQSNFFSIKELKKALDILIKLDNSLKTGNIDSKSFVELLVTELSSMRA